MERSDGMTTYTEVVDKVKRLSQAEKLALLHMLADSLHKDAPHKKRKQTLKSLYGALQPPKGRIPTNDELKQDYTNYLVEKYK
jgi:hypothetical protein